VRSHRQVEKEGFLRMLPYAFALLIPGLAVAYLQICHMRLGYEMRDIQERIRKEEELTRALELERSRLSRQEVVQKWAAENGFVPAKPTNLVQRPFTRDDQRMAKLRPVPSI
jgi:cell division protein FtsL